MAKRAALSLEEIAAEVGRLFGTTEAHARKWLQQRAVLLEALHVVRNNATDLIGELSGDMRQRFKHLRANAQAGRARALAGHPAAQKPVRKKRRLSAATRAKMRAAAKKRWAERRKNG